MGRQRTLGRRALLAAGGVTVVGLAGAGSAYGMAYATADIDTADDLGFANPLHIPPVDDGTIETDGTRQFTMRLAPGVSSILEGRTTETWGANGPILGPTLRGRRGEVVRVTVENALPEPTTIHWHGVDLPAVMDGGPHQMIQPGKTWSPSWAIDQPAATLWYHPHPHGATARHVHRGIAGLFIVEDESSATAGLPRDYGVDDIPLILQDRSFGDDGEMLDEPGLLRTITGTTAIGHLGDTMLVNGTRSPYFEVTTATVRLRLLNGSEVRSYNLGFADGRPLTLVATDGGLLPAPVALGRLPLAPGERAEVVATFRPGEVVTLRSFAQELGGGLSDRFWGGDDVLDLLRFQAAPTLGGVGAVPPALPGEPVADRIPLAEATTTRTFQLEGHDSLNGRTMDHRRIDLAIAAGSVEIWEVQADDLMHTFHIHGAAFRVLDIDGEAPGGHLSGSKDTVFVPAGSTVRLAVRFPDHVDPAMPYMYHCHLLRHEDNGMMGQFVVVAPGTEATTPLTMTDHAGMDHG